MVAFLGPLPLVHLQHNFDFLKIISTTSLMLHTSVNTFRFIDWIFCYRAKNLKINSKATLNNWKLELNFIKFYYHGFGYSMDKIILYIKMYSAFPPERARKPLSTFVCSFYNFSTVFFIYAFSTSWFLIYGRQYHFWVEYWNFPVNTDELSEASLN